MDAFEMKQTGPATAEAIVMTQDGVSTLALAMEPIVYLPLPLTPEDRDHAETLLHWAFHTGRLHGDLETALLQFECNPGSEAFVRDEITALQTFLAELRPTDLWTAATEHLLAKLDAALDGEPL